MILFGSSRTGENTVKEMETVVTSGGGERGLITEHEGVWGA